MTPQEAFKTVKRQYDRIVSLETKVKQLESQLAAEASAVEKSHTLLTEVLGEGLMMSYGTLRKLRDATDILAALVSQGEVRG